MNSDLALLSLVIWTPIIGGLLILAIGSGGDGKGTGAKWLALLVSVAAFLLSVPLYTDFDTTTHLMQFEEMMPWIEAGKVTVNYHIGVDGFFV